MGQASRIAARNETQHFFSEDIKGRNNMKIQVGVDGGIVSFSLDFKEIGKSEI